MPSTRLRRDEGGPNGLPARHESRRQSSRQLVSLIVLRIKQAASEQAAANGNRCKGGEPSGSRPKHVGDTVSPIATLAPAAEHRTANPFLLDP